jgi:hypothetical protein
VDSKRRQTTTPELFMVVVKLNFGKPSVPSLEMCKQAVVSDFDILMNDKKKKARHDFSDDVGCCWSVGQRPQTTDMVGTQPCKLLCSFSLLLRMTIPAHQLPSEPRGERSKRDQQKRQARERKESQ